MKSKIYIMYLVIYVVCVRTKCIDVDFIYTNTEIKNGHFISFDFTFSLCLEV